MVSQGTKFRLTVAFAKYLLRHLLEDGTLTNTHYKVDLRDTKNLLKRDNWAREQSAATIAHPDARALGIPLVKCSLG